MNLNGNPTTLIPSHPGNTNAVKHGVYSQRTLEPRVAELIAQLTETAEFTPEQRIAVEQVARCIAAIEALDRELDARGFINKAGEAHTLLNHRSRLAQQLERWHAKLAPILDRRREPPMTRRRRTGQTIGESSEHIAFSRDGSAKTNDRVAALKELLKMEAPPRSTPQGVTLRYRTWVDEDGVKHVESEEVDDSELRPDYG